MKVVVETTFKESSDDPVDYHTYNKHSKTNA